eukprot:TRINITY_DN6974_c0_g1_i1.p1 TRINITY_DN6974_c0_g1~~TRINITY_DN6974_c0_g1_i1.p1  ORF type:complete len:470 (-),score=106.16 TRINITY_DN6974_c0_g1_i1:520-1929(-)
MATHADLPRSGQWNTAARVAVVLGQGQQHALRSRRSMRRASLLPIAVCSLALLLVALAALSGAGVSSKWAFTAPLVGGQAEKTGTHALVDAAAHLWSGGAEAGRHNTAQVLAGRGLKIASAQPDSFAKTTSSSAAAEGAVAVAPAAGADWTGRAVLLAYIVLWYGFSIAFNIYFKRAVTVFPFPWACAWFQIASGCVIFGPLWAFGLRAAPKLTFEDVLKLLPAAACHVILQVGAVIAFAGGSVSFVHVVKAFEPVISAIFAVVFLGSVSGWPVYASLLPIIIGVGLASAKEVSFTWFGFSCAMISNMGSAGRAVYTKLFLSKGVGENMTSANTFSVLSLLGMLLLLPLTFLVESPGSVVRGLKDAYAIAGNGFVFDMVMSGLTFYLYSELAFLALGRLDAVSHSIANTMKRVVVIVAAIVVFKTKVTALGTFGSAMAVAGTFLYSVAKRRDDQERRSRQQPAEIENKV